MSKSLGNFFTIRDILKKYDAEVVRFFLLTAHYRSPIDFSDQNLEDARTGLTRFYECLQAADEALCRSEKVGEAGVPGAEEQEIAERLEQLEPRFMEAMDDDFNTALAIGHLFDATRGLNRLLADERWNQSAPLRAMIRAGRDRLLSLGEVLGLFGSQPAAWLEGQKSAGLLALGITPEQIERLIEERKEARKKKDFARADAIRQQLAAEGIVLLDGAQGTAWKVK